MEAGYIGSIMILFIFSMTLPCAVIIHGCCRLASDQHLENYSDMSEHELRCRRIALVAALDFILILIP